MERFDRSEAVISINFTLVLQVVHFLILVWIMNRLLIRPVLKHLAERDREIESRWANIDGLKSQAAERQAAYQARLNEATEAAAREREKLTAEANAEAAQLRDKAAVEGRAALDKVRAEIQAAVDDVRERLVAEEERHGRAVGRERAGEEGMRQFFISLAWLTLSLVMVLAMTAGAAHAAGEGSFFGAGWTMFWRIVNFAILAFAIYKVAKKTIGRLFRRQTGRGQGDL